MTEIVTNEAETLKQRLDLMGVKYHHNAGVEKLRALLEEHLSDETTGAEESQESEETGETKTVENGDDSRARQDELRALVRVFISCHDPSKAAWDGELISVGNSLVGTLKKYVAFNKEWHVPRIILDSLKEKQFQQHYKAKDSRGNEIPRTRLVKAYNIEELPPLTEKELKELAQRQAMANGSAEAL